MRTQWILVSVLAACRPSTSTQPEPASSQCPDPPAPTDRGDPEQVVRAYLAATAEGDLDAAAALVAADDSVVFESGGSEGTWSHYREHHLGPEVEMFETFEISMGEVQTRSSDDGSLAVVTVGLEYDITLRDERQISSTGTVTFSLRADGSRYVIEHMHWSSRRKRAPVAADPVAVERAAFDKARSVFESHCASCHRKGEQRATKKALGHFDMSSYPFGGHHASEIDVTIGKVLGIGGGKATMPKGKAAGSVAGDDLAAIEAWMRAFAAAKAAGAHGAQHGHDGGHEH